MVSLALLGMVVLNQFQIGLLKRQLLQSELDKEKYQSMAEVATSYNASLNETVTRLTSEMAANQLAAVEMSQAERVASKQLEKDLAVIRKGFEDAKDECRDKRPPDAVVNGVRAVYTRSHHQS
ncbi:hypothetical protein [Photobacterium ganghwense]|uniref:hypothetical protein n=1 Tax=Photobacterium ganghwense TaxID=320778 RepID=UPI001C2D6295|nr:hypothetical protein [Photobacterium ganghwense]MBV1842719.1 hypothetical protein [Photobacterium ganghwense]